MLADCRSHLVSPKLCPDLINQGWRACQATNGMDQPDRVVERAALPVSNFGVFEVLDIAALSNWFRREHWTVKSWQ
jgi:hypothetical protein